MDTDLALVLGMVLAFLSVPSMVSAFSDSRRPVVSAIVLLVGCGLIVFAVTTHPDGYTLAGLPHVVLGVVARFIP